MPLLEAFRRGPIYAYMHFSEITYSVAIFFSGKSSNGFSKIIFFFLFYIVSTTCSIIDFDYMIEVRCSYEAIWELNSNMQLSDINLVFFGEFVCCLIRLS